MVEVKFSDGIALNVRFADGRIALDGLAGDLELESDGPFAWVVRQSGRSYRVLLLRFDEESGTALLQIDGRRVRVNLRTREDDLRQIVHQAAGAATGPLVVKAPMPGLIRGIKVSAGQAVQKGDGLLILEAMKMENVLKSTRAGTVIDIAVAEGDAVEKGATLLKLG